MKNLLKIFSIFAILALQACGVSSVDGDEVAVIVKQPWFFGRGGVEQNPEYPGSFIAAWSTKIVRMKSIPIKYEIAFDDLFTKSKEPVDISAYAVIQIKKERAPKLYQEHGESWYDNRVANAFMSLVRDEAKKHAMPDIVSDLNSVKAIEEALFQGLEEHIEVAGLDVVLLEIGINKASPNPDVLEEINRTSQQNQRNKTESERASAELTREKAEINKALADKAYRQNFGMSNSEYLKLREIEIDKEMLEVVRNKENVTVILNSGAVPTFNAAK